MEFSFFPKLSNLLNSDFLFDAGFYLATNPDVAEVVQEGSIEPLEHYLEFGQFEGRNPSAFFDTRYYLETNPDVAATVAQQLTTPFGHYLEFGQFEGRNPTPLYDEAFYRTANPDVDAAIERDELTGIGHFLEFGQAEGRDPSPFFDISYYLDTNPDVDAAIERDELTALKHFVEFGQFEGRPPRLLFTQMYVFGDSLSDDGNLFELTGGQIPPNPPYFEGRSSNGPVWVEQLFPRLGLTANSANNAAVAGSTTGDLNINNARLPAGTPPLPGIQTQIDTFVAANPNADPNGLYVVWGGANDYIGGDITDPAVTIANLEEAIGKLAAVGAQNFLVPNLPDLGQLPLASFLGENFAASLSQLSGLYNQGLANLADNLEANSDLNIIEVDVNLLFNEAIANPAQFGITSTMESFLPAEILLNPNVTPTNLLAGLDPSGFLFWDGLHPTSIGHGILADLAVKTMTALSEVVQI